MAEFGLGREVARNVFDAIVAARVDEVCRRSARAALDVRGLLNVFWLSVASARGATSPRAVVVAVVC